MFGGVGRNGEGSDTENEICGGWEGGGFGELGEEGSGDGGEVGGRLPEF